MEIGERVEGSTGVKKCIHRRSMGLFSLAPRGPCLHCLAHAASTQNFQGYLGLGVRGMSRVKIRPKPI